MKKNYTKKMLLKVSLITLSLMGGLVLNAQTYGPNLVQEPGFENSGASWNKSGNIGWETNLDRVISGSVSVRFTNVNNNQWGNVNQVINVQPLATYKFGFTGRVLDAAGPSGGTYTAPRALKGEVRIYDGGLKEVLLELVIEQGTDITVSGEFQVPEGVDQIGVRLIKSFGLCYADDVILQMKDDVGTALNSPSSSFNVISNGDNSISIRSDEALKNISIINICGQTILSTSATNERIMLPRTATQGIYFVEATTAKDTKMLRRFMNK